MGSTLLASYATDWLDLLARWLHVIAAIAWIGSSFYFIALDNHLRPPADARDAGRGVGGETWEIHGGGFYRIEKFRVAPPALPDPLHWFKWEAYTTWLSGFALLVVVYYVEARTYLIDRRVADLAPWQAIAISIALLAVAWVVYDLLCRVLGSRPLLLAGALVPLTALAAWGSWNLFSGRGAFIQVGAMLGTMMAANVFVAIIPAHWELVRALEQGREPDPAANARGKLRSVHNNYLTLPVLLAMLSNHFPFAYGHSQGWIVLLVLMLVGAWVRHFFNLRHAGRNAWWIPASAAVAIAVLAVVIAPGGSKALGGDAAAGRRVFASAGCAACHTLRAAGSHGAVGPNLDEARPPAALVVERVANGQGAMPPFSGKLSRRQIADVAAYVSSVAGRR